MGFFKKKLPLSDMLGELCTQTIQSANAIRTGGSELEYDHPFWVGAKVIAGTDVIRYTSPAVLEAYFIALVRSNFIGQHGFSLWKVGVGGIDALLPTVAGEVRKRMYRDDLNAASLEQELGNLLPDLYTFLEHSSQTNRAAYASDNQHRPACEFLAEHLFQRSGRKISTTDATGTFLVINGLAAWLVMQQAEKYKPVC